MVRIEVALSKCRKALESALKEDKSELQNHQRQSPTLLSDEDIKRVKMMFGLAVGEKIDYPGVYTKIFLQEEIEAFSNYDLQS